MTGITRLLRLLRQRLSRTTDSSPEPWWGTSWDKLAAALARVVHAVLMITSLIGVAVVVTLVAGVLLAVGIPGAALVLAAIAVALVLLID